jgi:hypothetical protein
MLINLLPKFKIVEINNVSALRMGHVIAQTPAYVDGDGAKVTATEVGEYKFVENGLIVGYDATGVLANYEAAKHSQPCLVYNDELITGPIDSLDQYAHYVEDPAKPAYVRALPLYLNDTFTTNNYTGKATEKCYGSVGEDGVIVLSSEKTNALFIGKATTLPNREEAVELTYIGKIA